MGATAKLGFPWPELTNSADGPAAIQALAQQVELQMTNYNFASVVAYGNDYNSHVAPGAQTTYFSVDLTPAVIGWALIDVNVALSVGGPQGGRVPATPVQNAGGQVLIQQGATLLRGLRWHSRMRAEIVDVAGFIPLALPSSVGSIQLRIIVSCDSNSDAYGCDVYESNVSVSQFGAPR
jgi:hypothetical protein